MFQSQETNLVVAVLIIDKQDVDAVVDIIQIRYSYKQNI